MAKISIIFSTIALCLLTRVFAFDDIVNESLEDQERNYEARKLAEEYIWKQVDPQEEKWPHKEAGIIYKNIIFKRSSFKIGDLDRRGFFREIE